MKSQTKKPFFSIVIPTLNEEKYLPLLLRDLSKQTMGDFEVIHVDGSSDDATVSKAQQLKKKYDFTSVVVTERNVSVQRNVGIQKAVGKWIIFMDADIRLPNYFLEGVKYQTAKDPTFSIFSPWTKSETQSNNDRTLTTVFNFGMELFEALKKPSAFGACIGIQRSLATKIGFDTKQKVMEDNFFIQTAIKEGGVFKLLKDPSYIFSLRRFKKEGTLKMAVQGATIAIQYLQNKDFEKDNHGYVMNGGSYYDQKNNSFITQLQEIIKSASKKQLAQAKRILKRIMDA